MRRRRVLVATAFTVIALVAFASGTAVVFAERTAHPARSAHAASSAPAQTPAVNCPSPALGGTLPAQVYLPAGYSRTGPRYPVIYFLHGLPAGPDSYKTNAFVAGALASLGRRAIVVAPQGARGNGSDREYLDWSATENWPRGIAHDLTACIDRRFHTIADRFGRALIGLSAGGYGAFNIGLRNLHTFSAVESWSGYFVATDPTGDKVLDLGSTDANDAATVPRGPTLIRDLGTWPSMLAFYVGRQDSRFLSMNQEFDTDLTQSGIAHTFRIYAGGHSGALWRAQAPAWLDMALSYMSSEARARGRNGSAGV